jgi:hypothetical protein
MENYRKETKEETKEELQVSPLVKVSAGGKMKNYSTVCANLFKV